MRFLVDEDLPRSIDGLLRRYGHEAVNVRDIGLKGATDAEVASHAHREGLCLMTGDLDFSDMRNYSPEEYAGLAVLRPPGTATAAFILELVESFLRQEDIVAQLPAKLAIVEAGRIRMRPA